MKDISSELRKKAESLARVSATEVGGTSADEIRKLLYEFQVHQIELELQNQALKETEHQLLLSRDRFAQLYRSSPVGYLTLNDRGVITMANPQAALILGESEQTLLNIKLGKFINPSDQDKYHFFWLAIAERHEAPVFVTRLQNASDGPADFECQGMMHCGCTPEACVFNDDICFVEFRGALAEGGEEFHVIISIVDVTQSYKTKEMFICLNRKLEQRVFQQTAELTEANQELRDTIEQLRNTKHQIVEREAKLNAIFNAAVEGIITLDMSGYITSANDSAENIFGYSSAELFGLDVINLIMFEPHKKVPALHVLNNLAGIKEGLGLRKDGKQIALDVSVAHFIIAAENFIAVIVRDISERKAREQRDKEHLDELAHVTRLGLLGELASGIAHEVSQPLTAIVNYTDACVNLMNREQIDIELIRDILRKTSGQALRAGQLVHRMRDLIKAKGLQRSTVDINELVHSALGFCNSLVKQHSIEIRLKLRAPLPSIVADSAQIEQVVLNLIKNSIEALLMLPSSKQRKLTLETDIKNNDHIEIRIKDNGPGISEQDKKQILMPFFSSKSEGMGMGLSICRSIVEAHEGTINFNTCYGKGCTFYFSLPIAGDGHAN